MKRTRRFKFPYLELGDILYESDERERWVSADRALYGVSSAGVADGLDLSYLPQESKISVSAGAAFVGGAFVTASSASVIPVTIERGVTYNVYASRHDNPVVANDGSNYIYYRHSITFSATTAQAPPPGGVTLGRVYVNAQNQATIDTSNRYLAAFGPGAQNNSFRYFRSHAHTGAPQKIDLASQVTGVLPERHLPEKIPASKVSVGEIYLTDETRPDDVSHVGRVNEKLTPEKVALWTRDYQHYYCDTWGGSTTVEVYVNGVKADPSTYLVQPEAYVDNLTYGMIRFSSPLQATDLVELAVFPARVFLVEGGPWEPGKQVIVYQGGLEIPPSRYTARNEEGRIEFTSPVTSSEELTVTIRGIYISDAGNLTHDELEERLGYATSFLGWKNSVPIEYNTNSYNLDILASGQPRPFQYQAHSYILPQHLQSLLGTWSSLTSRDNDQDPAIEVPDGSADEGPVEPVTLEDNNIYVGQVFKATTENISKILLYASKTGQARDISFDLFIYHKPSGFPGDFLHSQSFTLNGLSSRADAYEIPINPVQSLTLGDTYYFMLKVSSQLGQGESVSIYRATSDYPDGYGFTFDGTTNYTVFSPNSTGSDDLWFTVFGVSTSQIIQPDGSAGGDPVEPIAVIPGNQNNLWVGQTFKATTENIARISVKIAKTGSSGNVSIRCELYSKPGEFPGSFILRKDFNLNQLTSSPRTVHLVLDRPYALLENGQTYYFQIKVLSEIGSGESVLIYRASEGYDDGYGFTSNGQTYTRFSVNSSGSDDLWFTVFGESEPQIIEPDGSADGQPVGPIVIDTTTQNVLWVGQTFKATTDNLARISLAMSRAGDVNAVSARCEVYSKPGDFPGSPILTKDFNITQLTEQPKVINLDFNRPYAALTPGSNYYFRIKILSGIQSGGSVSIYRASENYVDGQGFTFDGSNYSMLTPNSSGSDDLYFFVYGARSLIVVLPDGSANENPAEPVSLSLDQEFGQTFKATTRNIYKIQMFMSTSGVVNSVKAKVRLYERTSSSFPGKLISQRILDLGRIPPDGGVVQFIYNEPYPYLEAGNDYAFTVTFVEGIGEGGSILVYRATENYTDGYGFRKTETGYEALQPMPSGSDDFWFSIYGLVVDVPPPPPPPVRPNIEFLTLPTVVVNPAISIIIDLSGSTFLDTDPEGLRFSALKNFLQEFKSTYNAGETNPERQALYQIVYFSAINDFEVTRQSGRTGKSEDEIKRELTSVYQISEQLTEGVYAYPPQPTTDVNQLISFLDKLSNRALWGCDTPLHTSIGLAADRLRGWAGSRKKYAIVLTDGLDNNELERSINLSRSTVLTNYIRKGKEDEIKVFAVGFGTSSLSTSELNAQTHNLYGYGYFYNDVGSNNLNAIMSHIKSWSGWSRTRAERVHDLGKDVFLDALSLNANLPGESKVFLDIYVRSSEQLNWVKVVENLEFPNQLSEIQIKKIVRYIKLDMVLVAGSTPVVTGVSLLYSDVIRDYVISPLFETNRPLQEASMVAFKDAVKSGDALEIDFGVIPSRQGHWMYAIPFGDDGRILVPSRVNEPCIRKGPREYEASEGPWDGDYELKLTVNGVVVPRQDFYAVSTTGQIRFNRDIPETDNVRITLVQPNAYRMAIRITHRKQQTPLNLRLAWMYSTSGTVKLS